MLELRGEKDGFVHVNSVYLTLIENQYSMSGRKALLIVFQMVFDFAFFFSPSVIVWISPQSSICAERDRSRLTVGFWAMNCIIWLKYEWDKQTRSVIYVSCPVFCQVFTVKAISFSATGYYKRLWWHPSVLYIKQQRVLGLSVRLMATGPTSTKSTPLDVTMMLYFVQIHG